MAIRDGIRGIVGKRIEAVVAKSGSKPDWQVFLVFDDGTYYELYGVGTVIGCHALDRGGLSQVRGYCSDSHPIVLDSSVPEAEPEQIEL